MKTKLLAFLKSLEEIKRKIFNPDIHDVRIDRIFCDYPNIERSFSTG